MTKVLIIEDDHTIGEMLRLYFEEEGYLAARAETAQEGLSSLTAFGPDVIILDLILPDAQGTALCAIFREHTAVPIIVVSMKNETAARIQALTAGADDFLSKPFSMQELKARIIAVLRRVQPASFGASMPGTDGSTETAIHLDGMS